jgi:1,4-dihydroxy-2-naphthoate octaprenyltransferase
MISHWLYAARLKTLPVCVCPVLFAISVSMNAPSFRPMIAVVILGCVFCIQVGTNFANDYFDFVKGADTNDRVGPTRMTQSGQIPPNVMKRATWIMFLLAAFLGGYLVVHGGWVIFGIGVLSIFFGVIYTAGPFALAYIGGAEFISFLFFGPISVMGSYYLLARSWNVDLLYIGAGLGLITTALLVVNNTRDIDTDRQVNKKTWAVRFGPVFSYLEYIFCMYSPIVLLDIITENSFEQMVLLLFLVVIAMLLTKRFGQAQGELYNRLLGLTSAYLMLYTIIAIYLVR